MTVQNEALQEGVGCPEYVSDEHLVLMGLSACNPINDRDDEVRGCM
jgi:hypothetical protein